MTQTSTGKLTLRQMQWHMTMNHYLSEIEAFAKSHTYWSDRKEEGSAKKAKEYQDKMRQAENNLVDWVKVAPYPHEG